MLGIQTVNIKKQFWKDPTLWSLAAVNGYFIYLAIKMGSSNHTLIWLYWSQSVIIGLFNALRLVTLKQFSTKDFKGLNNTTDFPATTKTKVGAALFFMAHYGFFHLVYFIFLMSYGDTGTVDWVFVRNGAELFFVNSCFTFIFFKKWDNAHVPNIGKLMFFPYIRIVPIHLAIIFGGFFPALGTAMFVFLKTAVDLLGHIIVTKLQVTALDNEPQDAVSS